MALAAPMAAHAILPIEVFEAVIDQASHHVKSLHQLSLTCKTFLPRCRYHLVSSISIKTVQQMEASRPFLDSHSWVLPLVRKVTLSNTVNWDDPVAFKIRYLDGIITSNIRVLDVAPAHLLQLPNLRTWKMTTDVKMGEPSLSLHRRTLLSYKRYGHLVQDLELQDITFDAISDFRGLVSAFTGLQNLTCSSISFRTMEAFPDSPQANILAIPLKIKTLCIDSFTDLRAVEYLASNSATLSGLVLTLMATSYTYNNFKRLEMLTDRVWLSQLSSLRLVVEHIYHNEKLFNVDHFPSQAINCATSFFRHVRRNHLREARIEFNADGIYLLAWFCYSLAGTPLEGCRSLEEALLALPRGTILFQFQGLSMARRAGRRELWSSSIQNAFPQATRRGILTMDYPKADTPGPPDPLGHEARVKCLLTSHDSKHAATASFDGLIIVWDLERDTVAQQWVGHGGHGVQSIALSPNCPRLLSASGGGSERLVVWDFGNGVQRVAALESNTVAVSICAWSPDGTLIASGSAYGTVRVWCAMTFKQHRRFDDPDDVCHLRSLQFSPNARCLGWISISHENGYTCNLWRPLEDDQLTRLPSHSTHPTIPINAFAFDPHSTRIATAHGDKDTRKPEECVVRIWDVATGAALAVLSGHTRRVQDVAFSPGTGGLVLSVSSDCTARLWDLSSGTQIVSFVKKTKIQTDAEVSNACFSPYGEYIAIAFDILEPSAGVELRRAKDGSCVGGLTGHRLLVSHIAFSPNGEFLATGEKEGIVRIHRTSTLIRD